MLSENEWLKLKSEEFNLGDRKQLSYKFIKRLLKLYKVTKWPKLGFMICDMQLWYWSKIKKDWKKSPYQDILHSYLTTIEDIVETSKLPSPLTNVEIKDIRGFSNYNAESFPCFGENLIAVNSGVFFLSHVLARATEPMLISKIGHQKLPYLWRNIFNKKYRRASIAYICKDHTYALARTPFSISLISTWNDCLLTGLELFIISHEYAHLMIREYDYKNLGYTNYFKDEIIDLIYEDEEIAADAFAIIILSYYINKIGKEIDTIEPIEQQLLLYAPLFFFKSLSNYEEKELINKPVNHPINKKRHEYISKMIKQLSNQEFMDLDMAIDSIWSINSKKILSKCTKKLKKEEKLKSIYNSMLEDLQRLVEKGNNLNN